MGGVIALRFFENVYRSGLIGLERQVQLNVVTSIAATVRGVGAVAVLAWVSPTMSAFFVWQAIVSGATALAMLALLYRHIPITFTLARFSRRRAFQRLEVCGRNALPHVLSLLLTQLDKILLSKLITPGTVRLLRVGGDCCQFAVHAAHSDKSGVLPALYGARSPARCRWPRPELSQGSAISHRHCRVARVRAHRLWRAGCLPLDTRPALAHRVAPLISGIGARHATERAALGSASDAAGARHHQSRGAHQRRRHPDRCAGIVVDHPALWRARRRLGLGRTERRIPAV